MESYCRDDAARLECSDILKVWLQKMIMCCDLLRAKELCNENPVVVDKSHINEGSAPVSAANVVRLIFLFLCVPSRCAQIISGMTGRIFS
jgi:hypothetical protein